MLDVIGLAEALHGHLSPGVALGIRMGQIGLKKLGLPRGDKRLFAIVETARCLADGIQASTGCTVGHASLHVENFGKLAACIARSDKREGVRLTLKYNALPPIVMDWVLRRRKFSHKEEEMVSKEILSLDEESFNVEWVSVEPLFKFEETKIVVCEICSELVDEMKTVKVDGKTLCKACGGEKYYRPLNQ